MAKIKAKKIALTETEYRQAEYNYDGYCAACGEITASGGTEPDARNYTCDDCERRTVFGIQESLLMGFIEIAEED
jgi:hypothetical protein